ncbi:MAG: molecular chaperone HscC [Sphingopyxis sp.]|nr:molecular chaperone HscC [Sphingopyxis sp.]
MLVGIDLGTTNSAVAVWDDGTARLIPNALGELLTPSAVSIGDDGAILVGRAARDRRSTHPQRTATSFKRYMGSQQTTVLGSQKFSAQDLSALVLHSLKEDAERETGHAVTGAIITVPAYFNDKQRRATRIAGEIAGLKVERLINEPTAAALAYGIHQREDNLPFLVFDLGGGTFDISLVEMFDGIIEVRASAGDNFLGGDDFTAALAKAIQTALGIDDPVRPAEADALQAHLVAVAERLKRSLGDAEDASFAFGWQEKDYQGKLTNQAIQDAFKPIIARLRGPVLRAMRDSNIPLEGLGEIILVGGATRMPIVRRAVTKMFGRFPNLTLDPDHAVALGAAVQAGLKSRDAALDEIRLTDVCPFTLGVEIAEKDHSGHIRTGIFSPILERNLVIPASRSHHYSSMEDWQRVIELNVYQGESRSVAENVKLGTITVPIPPAKAGVDIECRFSYDTSGLLEVDVSIPSTGVTRQLVIMDDADSMTPDAIASRRESLAKLKVHPRDDADNAAILARANRCYQESLGDEREHIGMLIAALQSAYDSQDPRHIVEVRAEVGKKLDAFEGKAFL